MNLRNPLDLALAVALCAIAWAVPVMWLFVGPLLFVSLVAKFVVRS